MDRFVKMQLKELVDYLNYRQKKVLQKIALGKEVELISGGYLSGVGMVQKIGSGYRLFTPLLTEYIKTSLPVRLPAKEARLFRLLRQHTGQTVPKEEIFQEIWPSSEEASDWALDALIYRLRKHPVITAHGYIIESHKKVGYTLIQS